MWLSLLKDFDVCGAMSSDSAALAYLYRDLHKISTMETMQLHGCQTLLYVKLSTIVFMCTL